ncbi:MAG: FAD-binding protein, partial [Chloroflexota bacterium]
MNSELLSEFVYSIHNQFAGEIKTDSTTKKLYSTDASIYQIEPLGVMFPRNYDDMNAIVENASKFKIPILPRGSGSSLAGQTVGAASVIDCSRHLNNIVNINPEDRSAIV